MRSALDIQIPDIKDRNGNIIKDNSEERNRIWQSVQQYGDLSDEKNYNRFIEDLKAGKTSALDVLDAYDKLDITGKRELTNISGREIERQNSQKKKEDKK